MASNDVKATPETGKKGSMDYVSDVVNETVAYLQKDLKPLFINMLKIEATGVVAFLIFALIAGLLFFTPFMNIISQAITTPGSLSKEEMADQIVSIITNGGNLAMFAIGAFIGFMGLLLSTYITVTKYNLIAESMAGKKMSIFGQAKANAWPYTAYVIVMCILMGVIFVPGALAIVLGPTIAKLFGLLLLFLGALALIIIAFTFQFAIWELLIARKGPVESIKASFALVRSNLKKVFVFDLAYWAGAIGLSLIFSALQALVQFVGSLFMMLSPIAGILVYVGAYAIVLVIESAITGATLLVFSYMFWKKVRG